MHTDLDTDQYLELWITALGDFDPVDLADTRQFKAWISDSLGWSIVEYHRQAAEIYAKIKKHSRK